MSTSPSLPRPLPALSIALEAARRACLLVARTCGLAARGLRERARRVEDRDVLLAMSSRELNDLGLGRGDVERLTVGGPECRGQDES